MSNKPVNNVKLGIFVLAGLLFLILVLYMIGKRSNLFQASYVLRAHLQNVEGLVGGNNVRYAGIESGTVKKIGFVNDSLIEVVMLVDVKMKNIIRKDAVVSIGTEGLVGSKVVNILPSGRNAEFAADGDILPVSKGVNTSEMLQTLSGTNENVAYIAAGLKTTVQRINESEGLWALINDKSIPDNLRRSALNIQQASKKTDIMIEELSALVAGVRNGQGAAGALLADTGVAGNIRETVEQINAVATEAHRLTTEMNSLLAHVDEEVNSGNGPVNALLKDSTMVLKLNTSLDNIMKGTDGFNQNMEALKHNMFFRKYFRNLERQKKKQREADLSQQRSLK